MLARHLTMSTGNDDHRNTFRLGYLQQCGRVAIGNSDLQVSVTANQSDQPGVASVLWIVESPA